MEIEDLKDGELCPVVWHLFICPELKMYCTRQSTFLLNAILSKGKLGGQKVIIEKNQFWINKHY
jgi:hypothetical protein